MIRFVKKLFSNYLVVLRFYILIIIYPIPSFKLQVEFLRILSLGWLNCSSYKDNLYLLLLGLVTSKTHPGVFLLFLISSTYFFFFDLVHLYLFKIGIMTWLLRNSIAQVTHGFFIYGYYGKKPALCQRLVASTQVIGNLKLAKDRLLAITRLK